MAKRLAVRASVFKALVQIRLDDALSLLDTGEQSRRNGAIYLAGYAVECALKSRVCTDRGEKILDTQFYTHDLTYLLGKTQKHPEIQKNDFWSKRFHSIVSTWSVSMRYSACVLNTSEVQRFLSDCKGFSKWLLSE
jgi:hypothetical protein